MRGKRIGLACLVLVLAACQPPRVIATGPFPPAPAARLPARPRIEAPARQRLEAPIRQQSATWSFIVTGSTCEARAAGPDVSLALQVADDRALLFVLSISPRMRLPDRIEASAQVAFAGAEGSWTLPARRGAGRAVTVALPLDETSASQARSVLGGGTVRLAERDAVPALVLPDAGVAGRDWFGCVRSKLAS